jgi:hypothetical protein
MKSSIHCGPAKSPIKNFPILGDRNPSVVPIIAPATVPGHILVSPNVEPVKIIKRMIRIVPLMAPPTSPPAAPRNLNSKNTLSSAFMMPNGSAGEPWPAGPSVPSAGSTAAGGRNQRGSPADPFARPSAVGQTFEVTGLPLAAGPVDRRVRPHFVGVHPRSPGLRRHIDNVSADAKDTHARYGKSNAAESLLTRQNRPMVAATRTQRRSISAKARPP